MALVICGAGPQVRVGSERGDAKRQSPARDAAGGRNTQAHVQMPTATSSAIRRDKGTQLCTQASPRTGEHTEYRL